MSKLTAAQLFWEAVRGRGNDGLTRAFLQLAKDVESSDPALLAEWQERRHNMQLAGAIVREMVDRLLAATGRPYEQVQQSLATAGFGGHCKGAEDWANGVRRGWTPADPVDETIADFLFPDWSER